MVEDFCLKGAEKVFIILCKVTALRGDLGAYLPITKFWLKQTVNSPGSVGLSQELKLSL